MTCTKCSKRPRYRKSTECLPCLVAYQKKRYRDRGNIPITLKSKICKDCNLTKDIEHFDASRLMKDGVVNFCKPCLRKKTAKTKRAYRLKTAFGLTAEAYDAMRRDQRNCCQICKKAFEWLAVDHDHVTGKIRGLLCRGCNGVLGMLNEDPHIFQEAINYLNKYKGK